MIWICYFEGEEDYCCILRVHHNTHPIHTERNRCRNNHREAASQVAKVAPPPPLLSCYSPLPTLFLVVASLMHQPWMLPPRHVDDGGGEVFGVELGSICR